MQNNYKITIILFVFFQLVNNSFAKDILTFLPPDIRWSIALSQSSVDDWKQGNVNSIESSSSLDFRENIKFDTLLLRIQLKYALGILYKDDKTNDYISILPTDNQLEGEGVLIYPLGWKLDPFFSASFKTQIAESFSVAKNKKTATARLWDPVTSQQSWGFEYNYKDSLDYILSRIGFSLKQVRAYYYTRLTDDSKTRDIKERYKPESGIQWKSEARFNITSTLDYRGTLDTFSSFDDLTKWTIGITNEFKIDVWAPIAILIKIDFCYDEKQALHLQYKQSLRFGIVLDLK